MTEPTPEFVEIVKATCDKDRCTYPGCQAAAFRTDWCHIRDAIIRKALSVAFKQEPSEAMANEWCKLALSRIKRRMKDDNDCTGMVDGAKESYRAMSAQKLRDLGIGEKG